MVHPVVAVAPEPVHVQRGQHGGGAEQLGGPIAAEEGPVGGVVGPHEHERHRAPRGEAEGELGPGRLAGEDPPERAEVEGQVEDQPAEGLQRRAAITAAGEGAADGGELDVPQ